MLEKLQKLWMKFQKNISRSRLGVEFSFGPPGAIRFFIEPRHVPTENQFIENKTIENENETIENKTNVALVFYRIASVLPNTISFNFLKDWKVWFSIENREKKKYRAYIKIKFISGDYEKEEKKDYYGGMKAWNLNALTGIIAPGLGIPEEIKQKAKQKKRIKIRISCEVKDENNKLVEKKFPVEYIYDYENNSWYLEP